MAITRAVASSITQGLPKQKTLLAGNSTILPGSYESIATVTLSSSQATVTFSSIPSTYQHLQIRASVRDLRASTWVDTLWMYCNSDTTGTNYYNHILFGGGSSAGSAANAGQNSYGMPIGLTGATNVASAYAANVIDILDYANTSKNKTVRTLTGMEDNSSGTSRLYSSLWMSTAAITSLTLSTGSADQFAQYSSFALYGIR